MGYSIDNVYEYCYSHFDTIWFPIIIIIVVFIFLGIGLYSIATMYICDNDNCAAIKVAKEKGEPGSVEYLSFLLNSTYGGGLWSFALVGGIVISPIALWIMYRPITVINFITIFLVSFLVIYFLFSFFSYHYVQPLAKIIDNGLHNNCICTPDDKSSE